MVNAQGKQEGNPRCGRFFPLTEAYDRLELGIVLRAILFQRISLTVICNFTDYGLVTTDQCERRDRQYPGQILVRGQPWARLVAAGCIGHIPTLLPELLDGHLGGGGLLRNSKQWKTQYCQTGKGEVHNPNAHIL